MILDEILRAAHRRVEEAKLRVPPATLARRAERAALARRLARRERAVLSGQGARLGRPAEAGAGRGPFSAALAARRAAGRLALVAEVKRASPSAGTFAGAGRGPAALARAYAAGGAAALSVLTEPEFFRAKPEDLPAAQAASGLPVLRKDFVVDPYQVDEACLMGADAVLLILAALGEDALAALIRRARELGLEPLLEVHDERELDRALAAGAWLVGVNNRDLRTFETDLGVAERLLGRLRAQAGARAGDILAVAESGIRSPEDARRMAEAGADAALVGEALVTAEDPEAFARALSQVARCAPAAAGRPGSEREAAMGE